MSIRTTLPLLLTIGLCSPGIVLSQDNDNSDDNTDTSEEVFELSPFEVSSSSTSGYYARNTLAGSRISTDLDKLAQSITIVTAQQLEDVGAVDINDVFLYEANTEGTGNYTAISVNAQSGVADSVRAAPEVANRIRGLPSPDRGRNYFPGIAQIGMDSYNVDRVTINRGPNSILFGLGKPSGIVNYTLISPLLDKPRLKLEARYGEDDAYRGNIDINLPIVKDVAGIRLAAVYNELGFAQQPAHSRTERLFGSFKVKPFKNTTIKGYYEDIQSDEVLPNSITPRDFITPWREAGSPTWNPVAEDGNDPAEVNGLIVDRNLSRPVWMYSPAGEPVIWIQRHNGNPDSSAGTIRMASPTSPFQDVPGFLPPGVSDPSLYDVYGLNIQAVNSREKEGKVYDITLQQKIFEGLDLEVAYHFEELEIARANYLANALFALSIDPNETLINGDPNPYFNAPYIETLAWRLLYPEESESYRATLAYEWEAPEKLSWLGRHRISLLAQNTEIDSGTIRFKEAITDTSLPFVDGEELGGASGPANNIHRRFYLGEPGQGVTYAPVQPAFGSTFPLNWMDVFSDPFGPPVITQTEVTTEGLLYAESTLANQEVESYAMVWQSYLLEERLITTLGLRRDSNSTSSTYKLPYDSETGLPDQSYFDEYSPEQITEKTTSSLGVVGFPLTWLSLHFNMSENFTPSSRQLTPFGDTLESPTGEGKDYGFALSLLEDKLVVKFNWFEVDVENSRNDSVRGLWGRVARYDATWLPRWGGQLGLDTEEQEALFQVPEGFPGEVAERGGVTNLEASGLEIEVTYNPTPNWRIKFNAAQQETIESDIAPYLREYMDLRKPFYETLSYTDGDGVTTDFWTTPNAGGVGSGRTPEQWWNQYVDPLLQELLITEGKVQPQQREWRFNLITNYSFSEGRYKGLSVGGGLRWEDKGSIGFRGDLDDQGNLTLRNDPIYDSDHLNVDLWVGYSKRLFNRKATWSIKLNVRNVFEDKELRPIRANPDGNPSLFRIIHGRTWFLTSSIRF